MRLGPTRSIFPNHGTISWFNSKPDGTLGRSASEQPWLISSLPFKLFLTAGESEISNYYWKITIFWDVTPYSLVHHNDTWKGSPYVPPKRRYRSAWRHIYHILECDAIIAWYIVKAHEKEARTFLRNVDISLHDGIVTFTVDAVRKSDSKRNTVDITVPLCLTKQHLLKVDTGVETRLHAFLTSRRDGDEWSVSCIGQFISLDSVWAPELN